MYGGGLEALETLRGEKGRTLDGIWPIETMGLTIRYRDRYGALRESELPAVLNAAVWAKAWVRTQCQQLKKIART